MKTITHIRVSWAWSLPLASLVAGSLVFLLSVMWVNRSHKVKLWRASNLALTQAIDIASRPTTMRGMYDNVAMQQQAHEVRMRLGTERNIWTLWAGDRANDMPCHNVF